MSSGMGGHQGWDRRKPSSPGKIEGLEDEVRLGVKTRREPQACPRITGQAESKFPNEGSRTHPGAQDQNQAFYQNSGKRVRNQGKQRKKGKQSKADE